MLLREFCLLLTRSMDMDGSLGLALAGTRYTMGELIGCKV